MKNFNVAKFWLEPAIELCKQGNFTEEEINKIEKLIIKFYPEINKGLDIFYSGQRVKTIKK